MIDPQWLWIAGRAVIDTTLMLLWGCFGYLSLAAPMPLKAAITYRLAGLSAWCVTILGIAVLVILPAQVAYVADGWHDAVDTATVLSFLTLTNAGKAWLFLGGGTLLLVLTRFLMPGRSAELAALAGLTLASLTLSGHAAMNSGTMRTLHEAVDIVHVLSAGAWLGGLVGFVSILQATRDAVQRPHAARALRRFSTLGHVAVALVLLSGGANTLIVVGHLPTDWRSPYQGKLLIKIGLVMIMTFTAIANRYVFVPLLQKRNGWAETALRVGASFEILLGAAAIALVAIFGTEDPA
ncbi:copper homeostasis membrane protein CopD [Mesorhizobium sp. B2-8-3]|uniref:copper homeostasis membrane protein CopD n=1 Tax=Mesorhizobium sp. B2-8-3 TaxID=2589905 RepID=UPI00112BC18A|nr:copper homeostasis membrane protein CopD [Mesorhizobium sp. B2-8-3]TPJ37162.1 copper homeostasis membrane protein CopD [Mesorhizobium sp. B2-8-3]